MSITVSGKPLDITYLPYQLDVLYNKPEHVQFTVLTKGRRLGASQCLANYAIDAYLLQGKSVLWIDVSQSNIVRYCEKFFLPIMRQIRDDYWKHNKQQHIITFKKGKIDGFIEFKSAERPSSIEGFAYDLIVFNEAGIIMKGMRGRNLWQESVAPMILDSKAEVYFIGVPKSNKPKKDEKVLGYNNSLYYELYQKGLDPNEPTWRGLNFTTYDNPLLDKADIDYLYSITPRHLQDQEIKGLFTDIEDVPVFDRRWFQIVDSLPPVDEWRELAISIDSALEPDKKADDSVFLLGINALNGYYFLDMVNKKLDFVDLINGINDFYTKHNSRWPSHRPKRIRRVLIEKKASGHSALHIFKRKSKLPVEGITPKDDKFVRAEATTPICEAGNVYLLRGAWNETFISQLEEFNALMDTPDDIVDAFSQFINFFEANPTPNYKGIW